MYKADVVKIMIATPSDVPKERQITREAIYDWNATHSEMTGIVLHPAGWDTHAYPAMEGRPQEIINRLVLKDCDLLIAVFWTRLGSPTGKAPSGTVEEIREHCSRGKPAMIYFSQQPVRLDSVDEKQYRALRKFRAECEKQGTIQTFDAVDDYRLKLTRQLQGVIRDHWRQGGTVERKEPLPPVPAVSVNMDSMREIGLSILSGMLSDAARRLLIAGALDLNGAIVRTSADRGLSIQANGQNFVADGTAKSQAKWEEALGELLSSGLVRERGHTNEVFMVTGSGFAMIDRWGV